MPTDSTRPETPSPAPKIAPTPAPMPTPQPQKSEKAPNAGDTPATTNDTDANQTLEIDHKPKIIISPGNGHVEADLAEAAIAADGRHYTNGSELVRLADRGDGLILERVNEHTLRLELSASIDWGRQNQNSITVRCDPPHAVITALLHSQDRRHLKPLNGLAHQPYLGPDGRLVSEPGYHPESRMYAAFDPEDFRLGEPTFEAAKASAEAIKDLLSEYDFETDVDRSAVVAAALTASVRSSLPLAPAISITATTSGSGKSHMAEVLAAFASPGEPKRGSYPNSEEEARKLMMSLFMEKPAVMIFDDKQEHWKPYGTMNRSLTSPTITDRLLGMNRMSTVSTNVLLIGTGNNIEAERDMRRRVLTSRLAPPVEDPSQRTYAKDPLAIIRERRAEYVGHALTIIRAYQEAGSPTPNVRSIGSYDEWSRHCRHPLIWLGFPDPAQSILDQVSHDPDKEALAQFLAIWFHVFDTESVTTREIVERAGHDTRLMEAMDDLPVSDGRGINPGKLGWFISKNRGRRAGGGSSPGPNRRGDRGASCRKAAAR